MSVCAFQASLVHLEVPGQSGIYSEILSQTTPKEFSGAAEIKNRPSRLYRHWLHQVKLTNKQTKTNLRLTCLSLLSPGIKVCTTILGLV